MTILGITGGIGSGKSTVSELFHICGIPVYTADDESKKLVATSPVIREKLIAMFGEDLYKDGILNKALLASYIFTDSEKLNKVNAIIHPEVEKHFENWVANHSGNKIVAHEAAILFESGFNRLVDKVVMVYAPLEIRMDRVMQRDNTSRELVEARINNQMSDEEKAKLSDFVIVNDGTCSLIEQVLKVLQQIKNKS